MPRRRERLTRMSERLWWAFIPIMMLAWPGLIARGIWGRRQFARLREAGEFVTGAEPVTGGWVLRGPDASARELVASEVREGVWYQFEDHHGGFANTTWHTILALELGGGETLVLVTPEAGLVEGDDALAQLGASLAADRGVRGPRRHSIEPFGGLQDFMLAGCWILATLVALLAAIVWR